MEGSLQMGMLFQKSLPWWHGVAACCEVSQLVPLSKAVNSQFHITNFGSARLTDLTKTTESFAWMLRVSRC